MLVTPKSRPKYALNTSIRLDSQEQTLILWFVDRKDVIGPWPNSWISGLSAAQKLKKHRICRLCPSKKLSEIKLFIDAIVQGLYYLK